MKTSQFARLFSNGDLARTNLYEVTIHPHNPRLQESFSGPGMMFDLEDVRFRAQSTSLPGKMLGVVESRRFGAVDKTANDVITDSWQMTLQLSQDLEERIFFEEWINYISGGAAIDGKTQKYRFRYINEYIASINITTLARDGRPAAGVVLKDAFPTNVGPVELAWSNDGSYATCAITFAYRDWDEASRSGH